MNKKETYIKLFLCCIISFYCVFLLVRCNDKIFYGEIDSYALPTISIQYRGSILMQQEDLERAQIDYPNLYEGIDSFDKLRNSKLMITSDGKWESYYFPFYAFLCVPAKIVLQLLQLNQELAFGITNILCVLSFFIVLMLSKKLLLVQKILGIFLVMATPVFVYVQYVAAETMVFSFVGISILLFYEKKYKSGALFITLAGLQNSTMMVIGMVFIADYYIHVLFDEKGKSIWQIIKEEFVPGIKFACCFLPCFLPFILKTITGVKNFSPEAAVGEGIIKWLQRILAYLFDMNLGYFSFAPVLLISCIILFFYSLYLRNYRAISFAAAFLGTIAAFSLMIHINCGMPYCARYVFMLYPVLIVFMITTGFECMSHKIKYLVINGLTIMTSMLLLAVNTNTYYVSTTLNQLSEFVLNNVPVLYNPLHSTFNSRVSHIDGGYIFDTPVVYYDESGDARKILAKKEDAEELNLYYIAETDDAEWFRSKVSKLTENASYISIPKHRRVIHAPEYQMDSEMIFGLNGYNADSFVVKGLSPAENDYSWTNEREVIIRCRLNTHADLIHAYIELDGVYHEKQNVKILINGEEICQKTILSGQNIEFNFMKPEDAPYVEIRVILPDAVSPASLGKSSDERILGLAIKSMKFTQADQEIIYEMGQDIMFYGEEYNADLYVVKGISFKEEGWSWTDGHDLRICCNAGTHNEQIQGWMELADVYQNQQEVVIFANNQKVFDEVVKKGDHIQFDFEIDKNEPMIALEIKLPNAVSPSVLGESTDERELALAIKRMVFTSKR